MIGVLGAPSLIPTAPANSNTSALPLTPKIEVERSINPRQCRMVRCSNTAAVQSENYEQAASLRDQISHLEMQLKN